MCLARVIIILNGLIEANGSLTEPHKGGLVGKCHLECKPYLWVRIPPEAANFL